MNTIKFSHADYMNHKCTHREYHAQFVTDELKARVQSRIGLDQLLRSKDEHLNDIPLKIWDSIKAPAGTIAKLEEAGTYLTLATQVCIAKEAAQQIIAEHSK